MLSLSDNEFSVIGFLVRNFSERLTIRSIAQKLGFSAAGVFNILKKLEKDSVVTGEKLGTGLFYSINYNNRIAFHLASISLLYSEDKMDKSVIESSQKFKNALFDKKSLLIVDEGITVDAQFSGVNIIMKTEEELLALMRKKDPVILEIFKKGICLNGEKKFVELIRDSTFRY